MNVRKLALMLPVLNMLVMLWPARALSATSFFPQELCSPSGWPPVALLLVGLGIMALGAACLGGAIASAQALEKWERLTGSENPVTSRIACAVGAVVFTTLGVMIVLGWFRVW